MKNDTIEAVFRLIQNFLKEEWSQVAWSEDDLFDLESDIVTKVLLYEFPDAETSYETATFNEEEALIEVELDIGKVTEKIDRNWSDRVIARKAKQIVKIAIKSIKKNFKIVGESRAGDGQKAQTQSAPPSL